MRQGWHSDKSSWGMMGGLGLKDLQSTLCSH